MEGSNFQASFIPRKPLAPAPAVKPRRSFGLFSIICTLIFILSALSAGAAYGYTFILNKDIDTKKEELDTLLKSFEPALIKDLTRTDSRIESVRSLMDQHMALASFFEFLNKVTLKNIRFIDFKFTKEADKLVVTLNGQAPSFSMVSSQALEISKPENSRYFRDATISNLNLDKNGSIVFTFVATLNPDPFLYKNSINASSVSSGLPPVQSIIGSLGTSTTATSTATSTSIRR